MADLSPALISVMTIMKRPPDKTFSLYKNSITIDYWDDKHLYRIRETGGIPISVTKVTGSLDKPALKFWSVNLMRDHLLILVRGKKPITEQAVIDASKLHSQVTKKAATAGTAVHDFIEAYVKGQKPAMPTDKKVSNGVLAFLKWQDKYRPKYLASEQVVYSKKFGFVGLLDLKVTLGAERHKIVHLTDIKSGNAIYFEHLMQTAAYQGADEEESGQEYGSRLILRCGKDDGEFEAKEYFDQKKDYQAFLGLLDTKRRSIELKDNEKMEKK